MNYNFQFSVISFVVCTSPPLSCSLRLGTAFCHKRLCLSHCCCICCVCVRVWLHQHRNFDFNFYFGISVTRCYASNDIHKKLNEWMWRRKAIYAVRFISSAFFRRKAIKNGRRWRKNRHKSHNNFFLSEKKTRNTEPRWQPSKCDSDDGKRPRDFHILNFTFGSFHHEIL